MIPNDDFLKRRGGRQFEELLRHEIGHCNGWPSDHGGAYLQSHTPEQPVHNFPPKVISLPKPRPKQEQGEWLSGVDAAQKLQWPRTIK
jgi:hypothetical protein